MAKAKPKTNDLDDLLFGGEETKPRRRRVAAPAGRPTGGGPSGPAMSGGPSGPAMSGGPSGPAMSGGPGGKKAAAPATRRRRLSKEDMQSLYGAN